MQRVGPGWLRIIDLTNNGMLQVGCMACTTSSPSPSAIALMAVMTGRSCVPPVLGPKDLSLTYCISPDFPHADDELDQYI